MMLVKLLKKQTAEQSFSRHYSGFTTTKMSQPNKWCLLCLQGKVSHHIRYTLKNELWVLQFYELLNLIICQFRYKMRHYKYICFFRTLIKEEKFMMRELVTSLSWVTAAQKINIPWEWLSHFRKLKYQSIKFLWYAISYHDSDNIYIASLTSWV